MKKNQSKLSIFALLGSVMASLCCILPAISIFSGLTSLAAASALFESIRAPLIGLTILVLVFAWYQSIASSRKSACACEADGKKPFTQSRTFLSFITLISVALLSFPHVIGFLKSKPHDSLANAVSANTRTIEFSITNMTCESCAVSIENKLNRLAGVIHADVSYKNQLATVVFTPDNLIIIKIEQAIRDAGYTPTLMRRL